MAKVEVFFRSAVSADVVRVRGGPVRAARAQASEATLLNGQQQTATQNPGHLILQRQSRITCDSG